MDSPAVLDSGFAKWSKHYANLPERYLLRKSRKLLYRPPTTDHTVEFDNRIFVTRIPDYTMDRPWTDIYWQKNNRYEKKWNEPDVFAEPIREEDWMWFKGDRVEITKGKDKGKQGYINYVVQVP